VTKEVIMAEIGIEIFPMDGQALEWRSWATILASMLNLGDCLKNGVIDRLAYEQAVDESLKVLAEDLGVIPDTVFAILYALGRVKHQPDDAPRSNMARTVWPQA